MDYTGFEGYPTATLKSSLVLQSNTVFVGLELARRDNRKLHCALRYWRKMANQLERRLLEIDRTASAKVAERLKP